MKFFLSKDKVII